MMLLIGNLFKNECLPTTKDSKILLSIKLIHLAH